MEESILLFFIPMASGTPTLAQTPVHGDNGTGAGATIAATWGSPTTAGNLLIAVIHFNDSGGTRTVLTRPTAWTTVSTPNGNGWTSGLIRDGANNCAMQVFYIENAASQSGSQSFTLSSNSTAIIHLYEVAGMPASLAVDVIKAQSNATGTSWNTGTTAAPFSTDAFALAIFTARNTNTYTAASITNSFVVDDSRATTNATGTSNVFGVIANKIGSLASGGVTSTITVGTSRINVGGMLVFRNNGAKSGIGISQALGSGTETKTSSGTTYTKSGSGLSQALGSGGRARDVAAKTGVGISDADGSGSRSRNVAPKTGAGISQAFASGTRARNVAPKTGSGISQAFGSGAKLKGVQYTKAGSGFTEGVGSGTHARDVAPKAGAGITDSIGSGGKIRMSIKTGSGFGQSIGSGGKTREANRSGIGVTQVVGSGTRARMVAPKSGAGVVGTFAAGVYVREKIKSGSGISFLIASGSRDRIISRSGVGIVQAFASGLPFSGKNYFDSDTVIGKYVGSDIQSFIGVDAATVVGRTRILMHEIWSGDADLPHADDIIFTHGKVRIRVAPGLYV